MEPILAQRRRSRGNLSARNVVRANTKRPKNTTTTTQHSKKRVFALNRVISNSEAVITVIECTHTWYNNTQLSTGSSGQAIPLLIIVIHAFDTIHIESRYCCWCVAREPVGTSRREHLSKIDYDNTEHTNKLSAYHVIYIYIYWYIY